MHSLHINPRHITAEQDVSIVPMIVTTSPKYAATFAPEPTVSGSLAHPATETNSDSSELTGRIATGWDVIYQVGQAITRTLGHGR